MHIVQALYMTNAFLKKGGFFDLLGVGTRRTIVGGVYRFAHGFRRLPALLPQGLWLSRLSRSRDDALNPT